MRRGTAVLLALLAAAALAVLPSTPALAGQLTTRPTGEITEISRRPGGVWVTGWAGQAPTVRINRGSATLAFMSTTPDDDRWAFEGLVRTDQGGSFCAVVKAVTVDCADLTVGHDPEGVFDYLDQLEFNGGFRMEASGWAIDPDVAGPVKVRILRDGVPHGEALANIHFYGMPDLPGYGEEHEWMYTVTETQAGTHTLCAVAVNISTGHDAQLPGCHTYTITFDPLTARPHITLH